MSRVKIVQAACAIAALLAAPVLVSLAVGEPERIPTAIQEHAVSDGNTLQLGLATCNGDAELTKLDETSTEVRLLVVADKPDRNGDDCSDGMTITLSAPLGTRNVLDAATGKPVPNRTQSAASAGVGGRVGESAVSRPLWGGSR